MSQAHGNLCQASRTALLAFLAALPGLTLTAVAALSANALSLHADLLLTVFDGLVLLAALLIARSTSAAGMAGTCRGQTGICWLVALCMTLSACIVAWLACARIANGGMVPSGPGIILGLAVNSGYAVLNLWVLLRWRRQYRRSPSAFARSQQKAGYAYGRTLPYLTAGAAAAKYKLTVSDPGGGASINLHNETHIGWAAGAGVEHAFTDRWSARVEYRYTSFGEEDLSVAGGLGVAANVDLSTHDVRVGFNYHF